jgi:hypothetical protein
LGYLRRQPLLFSPKARIAPNAARAEEPLTIVTLHVPQTTVKGRGAPNLPRWSLCHGGCGASHAPLASAPRSRNASDLGGSASGRALVRERADWLIGARRSGIPKRSLMKSAPALAVDTDRFSQPLDSVDPNREEVAMASRSRQTRPTCDNPRSNQLARRDSPLYRAPAWLARVTQARLAHIARSVRITPARRRDSQPRPIDGYFLHRQHPERDRRP